MHRHRFIHSTVVAERVLQTFPKSLLQVLGEQALVMLNAPSGAVRRPCGVSAFRSEQVRPFVLLPTMCVLGQQ